MDELLEEFLVVALVCVVFSFLSLFFWCDYQFAVGILTRFFIVMHWQGINANIMSLAVLRLPLRDDRLAPRDDRNPANKHMEKSRNDQGKRCKLSLLRRPKLAGLYFLGL